LSLALFMQCRKSCFRPHTPRIQEDGKRETPRHRSGGGGRLEPLRQREVSRGRARARGISSKRLSGGSRTIALRDEGWSALAKKVEGIEAAAGLPAGLARERGGRTKTPWRKEGKRRSRADLSQHNKGARRASAGRRKVVRLAVRAKYFAGKESGASI